MGRILKILLSLPRTICFNFRYLPLSTAIKLPIWLAPNVRITSIKKGEIILNGDARPFLIRIGFHEADGVDTCSAHTIIHVKKGGKLIFDEDAHIGQGAILTVNESGTLTLGRNFAISGTTSIICSKAIAFGEDVQLSWNSLIMDSDAHQIFDESGKWINPPKAISIGNKVWIASNTTILKGVRIADNVIVSANSLVNKSCEESNVILGGQPAKILKKFGHFTI